MLLVGCMCILSSHLCFCLRVFVGTRCSHSYLSMPFFVSSQVRGINLPLSYLQPLEPPSFSSCQSATVSLFQLSLLCLYGVDIVFLPPSVPVLRRLPPLSSLSFLLSVLSRFRPYLASVSVSNICLWFFLAVVGHVSSWIGLESRIVLESWIV